jgi:hypothetical protein
MDIVYTPNGKRQLNTYMKSFKEFLREEDAKASTSTAVVGEKENPPFRSTGPINPHTPQKTIEPHPAKPFSPLPLADEDDTWEDYLKFLEEWFLEQYEKGVFEGWSEEEINEWYKKFLKKQKEFFDRPTPPPAQPTYG